jgi:hypothetical protein
LTFSPIKEGEASPDDWIIMDDILKYRENDTDESKDPWSDENHLLFKLKAALEAKVTEARITRKDFYEAIESISP